MHSPTHRWLRQALRIQRCTTRPLFTRPAWPRFALPLSSAHFQSQGNLMLRTNTAAPCARGFYFWKYRALWFKLSSRVLLTRRRRPVALL